ncbi:hypothetical protein CDAR_249731 [Caerostris darwini]|uniref:Uncharacterized protein n=1 Tax=Caerostris darwini TaxID=1538125 RepID=A0AAV4TV57_9ARAC|nr:hypothetical protein CDAR_7211 [Caerostris darwini]GIY49754.1 hypothetical protein CDAR_249731 [Caerostris darwini]
MPINDKEDNFITVSVETIKFAEDLPAVKEMFPEKTVCLRSPEKMPSYNKRKNRIHSDNSTDISSQSRYFFSLKCDYCS